MIWDTYQNIMKSNAPLHKPQLLLALWKYFNDLNQKQVELLKKELSGEFMRERNIWPLRTQYIFT